MTVSEHRFSTVVHEADFLSPDEQFTGINSDWERGPANKEDLSQGINYQAWHLTFAGGIFTVTPQTSGSAFTVVPEPGIDSVGCALAFDDNGHASIAWVDSLGAGHLYWYNSLTSLWEVLRLGTGIISVGLTLDDKRPLEVAVTSILLFYTKASVTPGEYVMYGREQWDRYLIEYTYKDPSLPFIRKCGMNKELRVQLAVGNTPLL
jgi:hypothetical protein